MKSYQIKIIKQLKVIKQLIFVVIGLLCFILYKLYALPDSGSQFSDVYRDVVVKTDTIWQTKYDTLKLNTKQFETVYHTKVDTVYQSIVLERYPVKLYKDTLTTDQVTIFSNQLIDGTLIEGQLSYALHIPEIVKTVHVKERIKAKERRLYAFGELGGNKTSFTNISAGLLYTHKAKWSASYRINMNPIYKPTHHFGVGYRIL